MDIEIRQKKFRIPRKYRTWIGGGVTVVAALLWLTLRNFSSTLKVDNRGLSIGDARQVQFDDHASVDGNVVPIQVIWISLKGGGIVMERMVGEGSHVRRGDVIVRLNNNNLDLGILNAESELAEKQSMPCNTQITIEQDRLNNQNKAAQPSMNVQTKERAYSRQTALQQKRLNSREEYLKAKEDYELVVKKNKLIAQRLKEDAQLRCARMNQMNDNLLSMRRNVELACQCEEHLNVRSQTGSEMGQLNIELGQSTSPRQKIGTTNDLGGYKVEAQVDEYYTDRVHQGLATTFEQNGEHYPLTIHKVYSEMEDDRFKIGFVFSGRRPTNIRAGQTYYVDLQLGESKRVMFIPKGTSYSVTGGRWTLIFDKDSKKAYRHSIRIGRQDPQYYEVLEGLQPDEWVIVSGYESHKDNEILVLE